MGIKNIPLTKAFFGISEKQSILQALKTKNIGSLGKNTVYLENYFKAKFKAKKCLLVGSGSQALEIAVMALGLHKNDEIICPSFTFVATVNSIVKFGLKARFVDINKKDLGLDPEAIKKAIKPKTKAVMLVHYGGISAQVKKIKKICVDNGLYLIEDAAQVLFSKTKDKKYLGTYGDLSCFSFHQTKNIVCGEGGMLVINNNKFSKICEEIRSFGTNREAFFRGEINQYNWQRIGGSYFMTELQAAILKSQIEKSNQIYKKRRFLYKHYFKELRSLIKKGIKISIHSKDSNIHIFWIICKSKKERLSLLNLLNLNNIKASFHFLPLHLSPFVKKNPNKFKITGRLTNSTFIADRILRIPLYPEMSLRQLKKITKLILNFYGR